MEENSKKTGEEMLEELLGEYHRINMDETLGTDADMETFNRVCELHKLRIEEKKLDLEAQAKELQRQMDEEKSEFERYLEQKRTVLDYIKTGATVVGAFFTGAIGVWEFSEMLNFEETGSIRSTVGKLVASKWGKK
jgi:ABC-type phosphate transport system auxiliary subunit